MTRLNPYLNFAGNTEEAFRFYKSIFGGEFASVVRFKDMPVEGVQTPKKDENKIMHIGLPIGKDHVLMDRFSRIAWAEIGTGQQCPYFSSAREQRGSGPDIHRPFTRRHDRDAHR